MEGKFGCVRRLPDIDCSRVMLQIIDAIRYGPSEGFARKVMDIHLLGLLTPDLSGILEVADQFFLFGVHANTGLSSLHMRFALLVDVRKLTRSLTVVWSFSLFMINSPYPALA